MVHLRGFCDIHCACQIDSRYCLHDAWGPVPLFCARAWPTLPGLFAVRAGGWSGRRPHQLWLVPRRAMTTHDGRLAAVRADHAWYAVGTRCSPAFPGARCSVGVGVSNGQRRVSVDLLAIRPVQGILQRPALPLAMPAVLVAAVRKSGAFVRRVSAPLRTTRGVSHVAVQLVWTHGAAFASRASIRAVGPRRHHRSRAIDRRRETHPTRGPTRLARGRRRRGTRVVVAGVGRLVHRQLHLRFWTSEGRFASVTVPLTRLAYSDLQLYGSTAVYRHRRHIPRYDTVLGQLYR